MAQEMMFAAPKAEEMTEVVTGIAGAGITGVVEGTVVMFSKQMGALEPILSWGALLGVPAVGVAGALFMKGLLGKLSQGIAAGGTAILGYSLPAMLAPQLFAKKGAPGLLGTGNHPGAKLLSEGPAAAAEAAAIAARRDRVGIEF